MHTSKKKSLDKLSQQSIHPLSVINKIDHDTNNDRSQLEPVTVASCGPQLASDMDNMEDGRGKWRNDSSLDCQRLEK